ncbi:hypothetical protein NO559_14725 [Dasania sp. GY-MA-18]|uniref:Uncharacterized protein n=1 Tax=Dasania phycosphaerae TaxID=2950436 RepID=A0A9J6RR17_9GAMM|nr:MULTISPECIES: hypothetical protein [Dasania]MCR8924035.1 hypothetical protein [Dasania sp. GY-MA-18]MCZ0866608.1 hypothetical protein [Dasania phycosphaerae]MCZ0870193.1 hypothetical protein [Dasania phycosphaerae]
MKTRLEMVSQTRNYVLSVCALVGVGEIVTFTHIPQYPMLRLTATAFALAILIAIVHIGVLWWQALYQPTLGKKRLTFFSGEVRGEFSLLVFILLIALGFLPIIYYAASSGITG